MLMSLHFFFLRKLSEVLTNNDCEHKYNGTLKQNLSKIPRYIAMPEMYYADISEENKTQIYVFL